MVALIFTKSLIKRERLEHWEVVNDAPQNMSDNHKIKLGGFRNVVFMSIIKTCVKFNNKLVIIHKGTKSLNCTQNCLMFVRT